MNIFDYEGKEFDEKLDEIFRNVTKEQLKKQLIECGLEIDVCQKLDNEILINTDGYKEEDYYIMKDNKTWLDYIRNRTSSRNTEYIITKNKKEMVA